MSTDKEKIEKAADTYELKTGHYCGLYECCYSYIDTENSFKAGVTWRDANPSEDVLALVATLKKITSATYFCDAHRIEKKAWTAEEAEEALSRWDARGK